MNDVNQIFKEIEEEYQNVKEDEEKLKEYERLQELYREYNEPDRLISFTELAEDIKNRPPETKFMSGFSGLDDILDGFRKQQLIVLAAPTKSGKTTFAVELTVSFKDHNPLWLPFEESAEEIVQKFTDRDQEPPHAYTPKQIPEQTLKWVEKKIIEAKVKYESKVVFIDHLHFLVDFDGENMSNQIGKTMRAVKQLAKKWDMVIFLVAHLKKTQIDRQPDLEQLRDSSFVAQEADTVIMLWRQAERVKGELEISNNVNVSVQANRRTGKTGNVKFVFKENRFYEQDWQHEEDDQKTYDDF